MMQRLIIWLKNEYRLSATNGAIWDIARLMTGSVLSQAIPILAAPVVTRIYKPADYGILGLYISISGLISILATMQLNNAIVVAKNEEDAQNIIGLCIQILLVVTCLSFLIVFILIGYGIIPSRFSYTFNFFWLIPVSVFFTGLAGIFNSYAIRHQRFALVSKSGILNALVSSACAIGFGLWLKHPIGLFIGLWLSQVITGIFIVISTLKKIDFQLQPILYKNQSATGKRYFNFFRFSLPAAFINNFTHQIPVLMLNAWSFSGAAGSYNLSNRILALPMGMVSGPFGEVFFQRASRAFRELGSFSGIFIKTLKSLSLLSILPFVFLILFAPRLFVFVFGDLWEEAGHFARIMGLMYFLRFTTSPLSRVLIIVDKQYISLIIDIYLLISNALIFYYCLHYLGSVHKAILFFSLNYSFLCFFTLWISYKYSRDSLPNTMLP